jgi:hypothetical protein
MFKDVPMGLDNCGDMLEMYSYYLGGAQLIYQASTEIRVKFVLVLTTTSTESSQMR